MIGQRVIVGTIALEGVIRLGIALLVPVHDRGVRIVLAVVFLLAATAGFLVIRWDARRERATK